ncbi:MAG: relaxase/mobilization nuclease domain-containing protein, partial [Oscillospiraceae bacterium]|nr:relaxase/mobilization nuclease domain-containing protein [Oscillospiraceae bacterium]
MYGNVKVDYKPCKSSAQLRRAADYLLGRQAEQIRNGVVKTEPDLYWSLNCDRDHFVRDVLMTRELFGKKPAKNANLAYKMSISFSPEDNDKLTYQEAFRIAKAFAKRFFQGYEVLFAVHTDTPHKHVHFLIGNCHIETGRAFRRNERDLREMSGFFGAQCMQRGLIHSVRNDFYHCDADKRRDKETFAERQMKARGKETFKDELREVIQIELSDPNNRTLEDVVCALMQHYHVECRVKGN